MVGVAMALGGEARGCRVDRSPRLRRPEGCRSWGYSRSANGSSAEPCNPHRAVSRPSIRALIMLSSSGVSSPLPMVCAPSRSGDHSGC